MSPNTSMRRLFVALIVLVVFAASCGDDASNTGTAGLDTDSADDAGTESDDSSDDTEDGGDDEETVDDAGSEEPDDDQSTDDPVVSLGNADVYCTLTIENDARTDNFDPVGGPEATQEFIEAGRAGIAAALATAPPEIAADLALVAAGIEEFSAVVEANDWDLLGSLDEIAAIAETPERQAAEDRIDAWEEANCDLPDGADDTALEAALTSPDALEAILGTETGRNSIIDALTSNGTMTSDEAGCLIDNLDLVALAALAQGEGPTEELFAQFFEALGVCGIPLESLTG